MSGSAPKNLKKQITKSDLEHLYFTLDLSAEEIGYRFNCSKGSIYRLMKKYQISTKENRLDWSAEQDIILKKVYPTTDTEQIQSLYFPDRTIKAIRARAERLGVRKEDNEEPWTKSEDTILETYYPKLPKGEMLELLPGRTWIAIQSHASKMNVRKYKKFKEGRTNWNQENIEDYPSQRNYKIHGEKYKKPGDKIWYINVECEQGHQYESRLGAFVKGNGCEKCLGTARKTLEEIVPVIKGRGYKLISMEYINYNSKLHILCPEGHDWHVSWASFKKNNCFHCFNIQRGGGARLDLDYIKEIYSSKNCTLLSFDYVNVNSHLDFVCDNHQEIGVQTKQFANFLQSEYGCRYCGLESRARNKRINYDIVVDYCKENNFSLLTKEEDYLGITNNIQFVCNKHPNEGTQEKVFHVLKQQKYGCNRCWNEANSGGNHYKWRGGISSLSEYLRGKIISWKIASLKSYNYRCDITNNFRRVVVHHKYPFHEIIKETLITLDIPLYDKVADYSEQERNLIEERCIELHFQHGLGVCLHEEVHNLFHREYSSLNFKVEDYDLFKQRYLNGEFKCL